MLGGTFYPFSYLFTRIFNTNTYVHTTATATSQYDIYNILRLYSYQLNNNYDYLCKHYVLYSYFGKVTSKLDFKNIKIHNH